MRFRMRWRLGQGCQCEVLDVEEVKKYVEISYGMVPTPDPPRAHVLS